MSESKAMFEDIILNRNEVEGIEKLKLLKELHQDSIPGFAGLLKDRFICLAHPETIMPDGYGGYTSDEIYKLSETYLLYVEYMRKNGVFKTLELLGEFIP